MELKNKTGMIQLTLWREDDSYDKSNPVCIRANAIIAIVPLSKTDKYGERTRVDYGQADDTKNPMSDIRSILVRETSAAVNIKRLGAGDK